MWWVYIIAFFEESFHFNNFKTVWKKLSIQTFFIRVLSKLSIFVSTLNKFSYKDLFSSFRKDCGSSLHHNESDFGNERFIFYVCDVAFKFTPLWSVIDFLKMGTDFPTLERSDLYTSSWSQFLWLLVFHFAVKDRFHLNCLSIQKVFGFFLNTNLKVTTKKMMCIWCYYNIIQVFCSIRKVWFLKFFICIFAA